MAEQIASYRGSFSPWNDPSQSPLISFKNVTKRYGAVTAVDNLSLDIYEREFFALLGPSGCGKTTLMRMLAGFETPSEGEVLLAGEPLNEVPPNKRPVNMMFQSYALFPHMNVEKNIGFGLRQEGMPKAEINDRVAEMLSLVKMQDYAKRKPDQLSGGQRQRVALARSLAKQPKVLLLDEPLGALDRKLREETQFELMDLQERLGITFMIVTHDQEEAMTVSDRIAVMRDGKLVQIDPPADMYERPNSRYVAGFLGDINLFDCSVTSVARGVARLETTAGEGIKVVDEHGLTAGQSVSFSIRPQKMMISRSKPKSSDNALKGEVWDIAYLGDMTIYKVKLENGAFAKVSVLNREISSDPITWEQQVWLSFPEAAGRVLTQ